MIKNNTMEDDKVSDLKMTQDRYMTWFTYNGNLTFYVIHPDYDECIGDIWIKSDNQRIRDYLMIVRPWSIQLPQIVYDLIIKSHK